MARALADPFVDRVCDALRRHECPADEDAAVLIRDLQAGKICRSRAARLYRRKGLLQRMAAAETGSARERAQKLTSALQRYAATGFARDRREGSVLDGRRAEMFEVVDLGGGRAPGFETVRHLIAA